MFPYDQMRDMPFWQKHRRSDAVLFSPGPSRWCRAGIVQGWDCPGGGVEAMEDERASGRLQSGHSFSLWNEEVLEEEKL